MELIPFVLLLIESEDDRRFLENVYLQYRRLMYVQALQILKQSQAAEDAVSDSLLALTKKISLLRGFECNKLRSYIVITVKHTAVSRLNRGKREALPGDAAFDEIAGTERTDGRLLAQAGVEAVKDAIRALPPREKDLMLMKYFREMTEQEIAEETGLRPVSVRVHLSRARKRLARLLQERGEDA
jgi:RNA polymerase sigma-70 factor (ECF subfamily)